MKKKIALVKCGFIGCYLEYFEQECLKHGIAISIFDEVSSLTVADYDYILTDCQPTLGCCNVFHAHSILARVNSHKFLPAKFIFYLGHLDKIRCTRKIYNSMPKLICVSETLKKDFVENYGISPDKIIVAYPGFYQTANNDLKKFRKFDYGKPFVVGIDARGFVNKGGYVLLDALKHFRRRNPQVKILAKIIYPKHKTNWFVRTYVKLLRLTESVKFVGLQEDMNNYYDSVNCFVSASILESFGRVIVEAMYAKIPVIVGSNVGASQIIEDGVNGFVFDASNEPAHKLALKLETVYKRYNTLEPLVDKAYEQSKAFTWENFAKHLFEGLFPNKSVRNRSILKK